MSASKIQDSKNDKMAPVTRPVLLKALRDMIHASNDGVTFSSKRLAAIEEKMQADRQRNPDVVLALQEMVGSAKGTHEISDERGEQIFHLANTGIDLVPILKAAGQLPDRTLLLHALREMLVVSQGQGKMSPGRGGAIEKLAATESEENQDVLDALNEVIDYTKGTHDLSVQRYAQICKVAELTEIGLVSAHGDFREVEEGDDGMLDAPAPGR